MTAARPVLHVGNRNYSSWSLRPYLALRWAGVDFDTLVIPLGGEGYGKSRIPGVLAVSPSGRVPVLHLAGVRVWDSLAISEWAAEQAPAGTLWPTDPLRRAVCRSVVAEMHSGFGAIRRDMSMNIRRRVKVAHWPDDVRADLERLFGLWTELRGARGAGGPHLFGARSLADAFFTPVATRLRTYGVPVPATLQPYVDTLLADAAFVDWERDAAQEPWTIAETDALHR